MIPVNPFIVKEALRIAQPLPIPVAVTLLLMAMGGLGFALHALFDLFTNPYWWA